MILGGRQIGLREKTQRPRIGRQIPYQCDTGPGHCAGADPQPLDDRGATADEGIVPGGGVALIRAKAAIEGLKGINEDQTHGIQIALRAMEAPLREIVTNAGEEPSVIVNEVKAGSGNFGYNAANGQFGDMVAFGILDPTKVTRTALQNAASIAGLMITTEAMVSELPKKEEPAMPGGGGMGGMGGMDF